MVETPICIGPRRLVDKDCWPVFELVPGDRVRDVDVLEAIFSLVKAHVEAQKPVDTTKETEP